MSFDIQCHVDEVTLGVGVQFRNMDQSIGCHPDELSYTFFQKREICQCCINLKKKK